MHAMKQILDRKHIDFDQLSEYESESTCNLLIFHLSFSFEFYYSNFIRLSTANNLKYY